MTFSKEQRVLNAVSGTTKAQRRGKTKAMPVSFEPKTPIATDMYLPNTSNVPMRNNYFKTTQTIYNDLPLATDFIFQEFYHNGQIRAQFVHSLSFLFGLQSLNGEAIFLAQGVSNNNYILLSGAVGAYVSTGGHNFTGVVNANSGLTATTLSLTNDLDMNSNDITEVGTLTFTNATGVLDLNGARLILDSDGDTFMEADTDDNLELTIASSKAYEWDGTAFFPSTNERFDLGKATNSFLKLFADGTYHNIVTKTGNYTALNSDHTILCSTNSFTITLPAAADVTGLILNIKNITSGTTITVDGNAAETIDGSTTISISNQYNSVTIQSDGSNWHIL